MSTAADKIRSTRDRLRSGLVTRGEGRRLAPTPYQRRAAVLIPFFERGGEPHVLFTERTQHLRRHKGEISFPGGKVDEGDPSLLEAALRETREEIGLVRERVELLGELDDITTVTDYVVTPFVGWIPGTEELLLNPHEIARLHEVPLARLLDPAVYELKREFEWRGRPYPVHFFHVDDATIWGATAKILSQLLEEIFGWDGKAAAGYA